MPWCEECAKFWNPASLAEGGNCPRCGRVVQPATERADPTAGMGPDDIDTSVPWHFWVMLAALVLYLAWRLVQGIVWILQ